MNRANEIGPLLENTAALLLKPVVPDSPVGREQKLQTCLTIGDLYSSARQFDGASRWHRRAFELDPQQISRVAQSMAEIGRLDEAIEWCVKAGSGDSSPRPAIAAASALLRSSNPAEIHANAEELITRALESHPTDTSLLSTVGALRVVQHRADDAIAIYRKLVGLQPENVEALNNLATMLGESPDQLPEALKHIDDAIALVGPQPDLLDTKGTILVALDRAKEGVELLSAAASAPNGDPRFHLHLAVGYLRAGETQRAKEALTVAKQRELGRQILTESDTKLLAELDERFK
jgi:tetratricopeptide (TPR) repeat protein